MSVMECDSVVVGGGVMGYSAALELAKTGRKTVLLEQFPSPHTRGSSTGHSRITRVANDNAVELNPIMVASLAAWKEIQSEIGKQLFVPWPMLCIGKGEFMNSMRQTILDSGNEPKYYTTQEVKKLYGYQFSADMEIFADPAAGVLMADQCILALKQLFEKCGGIVMDRWPVSRVDLPRSKNSVVVHGSNGDVVQASRAVICAGAWTAPLMTNLGLNLPLRPVKVSVCYWRQKNPKMPTMVFVTGDPAEGEFYGLPAIEYPGMVKIGGHSSIPCDPNNRDLTNTGSLIEESIEFVKKHFPCLLPEPAIVESCMYTLTPDEAMIVDRVPGFPNIAYGCGFSGTGFKMGPIVGRLLCQLVTDQPLDHDIARFAAKRFATSKY